MKLREVCDLVREAVQCPPAARVKEIATLLQVAISKYLDAFKEAYGVDAMRFKHHQLMHIVAQLLRDLMMLTCFTLERKHITSMQCFANYKNAEFMPAGALARMVNAQVCGIVYICLVKHAAAVSTARECIHYSAHA